MALIVGLILADIDVESIHGGHDLAQGTFTANQMLTAGGCEDLDAGNVHNQSVKSAFFGL